MKTINKKKVGYIELDAITPDPLSDNQVWTDGDDLFVQLNGVTKQLNDQSGGGSSWTVVSSSQTATNDAQYIVVASATFTDPTPVEGKGYRVFVRNGTATVGSTAYAVAGTIIDRIYHSGAWANYTNIDNLFQILIDLVNYDNSTLKAPLAMKINSVSQQSGSTTILVNAGAYTLGNSISQYDSIKVTNAVGSLVTLNCEKT